MERFNYTCAGLEYFHYQHRALEFNLNNSLTREDTLGRFVGRTSHVWIYATDTLVPIL